MNPEIATTYLALKIFLKWYANRTNQSEHKGHREDVEEMISSIECCAANEPQRIGLSAISRQLSAKPLGSFSAQGSVTLLRVLCG
jgi:hypothetical protein